MTFSTTLSVETYRLQASRLTDRQLRRMLADAQASLAHHGRRSWSGKEARKEITAATEELQARGLEQQPAQHGEPAGRQDADRGSLPHAVAAVVEPTTPTERQYPAEESRPPQRVI